LQCLLCSGLYALPILPFCLLAFSLLVVLLDHVFVPQLVDYRLTRVSVIEGNEPRIPEGAHGSACCLVAVHVGHGGFGPQLGSGSADLCGPHGSSGEQGASVFIARFVVRPFCVASHSQCLEHVGEHQP